MIKSVEEALTTICESLELTYNQLKDKWYEESKIIEYKDTKYEVYPEDYESFELIKRKLGA